MHVHICTYFYVRFSSSSPLFLHLFLRAHPRAYVRLCVFRVHMYVCVCACRCCVCACAYACLRLRLRAYPYRLVTPLVSSLANRPRLPRSLAHSYFQFASESKGLIKSPQTGFSGISRVNAKEIQPPARPECLYCRPIAYRSTTTAVPSPSSQTPLAYLETPRTLDRAAIYSASPRLASPRLASPCPAYFRKRELLGAAASLWHQLSLIIRRSNVRRSPFEFPRHAASWRILTRSNSKS